MAADKNKIETAPRVPGDENMGDDLKKGQTLLKSGLDELGYWDTVKLFWKAVLICNLISIAAAADGYQYTLNGNVIANKGFIKHVGFVNAEGKSVLNANYTALWGAMQSLGQLVAMVFMSPISDAIGRKMTLYTLWVILAGSIALETVVRDWRDWTAAKILAGIGVGALQSTLPVYIAEWSPSNIRGAMVLTYGVWNTLGKFLAPLVLLICEKQNPMNYKMPILTQWYYAERGQDENGKKTLARVNGKVAGYDVDTEYAIIKNSILEQRKRKNELEETDMGWKAVAKSYVDCFKGVNAKRTLGATAPACAQQLTGLSFLKTYSSLFFRQAGFDDPFLITTVITVIALVTSMVERIPGKSDVRLFAKPCGSIIVATMCYLTWARFEVTTIRQGINLVALSCTITLDVWASEGELKIVISKVDEESTQIEVKAHFPGIFIDWGRSKRILTKLFAFCEEAQMN
ncbi:hypothetical protein CEP54_012648 [Fusarium duplospermum]|uniref:Major facilitator superfamily (MFS) profile domain-containing protein n=1 Tax=Fusarium duplospermum TaxID=1325734 RepID=A0A428P7H1_9HYPO|nr:hypothetical protein CEP54_012648 [Fusarium duplospermum]